MFIRLTEFFWCCCFGKFELTAEKLKRLRNVPNAYIFKHSIDAPAKVQTHAHAHIQSRRQTHISVSVNTKSNANIAEYWNWIQYWWNIWFNWEFEATVNFSPTTRSVFFFLWVCSQQHRDYVNSPKTDELCACKMRTKTWTVPSTLLKLMSNGIEDGTRVWVWMVATGSVYTNWDFRNSKKCLRINVTILLKVINRYFRRSFRTYDQIARPPYMRCDLIWAVRYSNMSIKL